MNEEPIINAQLRKFQESFSYLKLSNEEAFERFANYSVLLQHQPDAFSADSELLDVISVGGAGDGGIDGIAIKVNGILIKTVEEIEDILKLEKVSIFY